MCGIFGYIGFKQSSKPAAKICIDGLKKLEYRGYDSAGIAGIIDGKIRWCKEMGKIAVVENKMSQESFEVDFAIAQTRWATHGKPSEINAHPHLDEACSLAVVHNGIIENYDNLKQMLQSKGVSFRSETDTEVIAQLIAHLYEGDLLAAVRRAYPLLKGSYAVALIHRDHPDQIVAMAHECPLAIGVGNSELFLSSDTNAFLEHTRKAIYLTSGEVAVIKSNSFAVYDESASVIHKQPEHLSADLSEISKGQFEHFMLKEIYEQPQTLCNALLARYSYEYGNATLEGLNIEQQQLAAVKRILILGCGTSWHAGCVAGQMIEDCARIPVDVEISSEYRYKNPIVEEGTFALAISQSGETADTIAAVRELKAKGAKIIGICNVQGSTLTREADHTLLLRAGAEIGVASTKAFTSQLVTLALFSLMLGRARHMSKTDGQRFLEALQKLPEQVQQVLDRADEIQRLAKKYAKYENFFFLGRRYMYPTCLEGALKLKEISYINANGYPAGEMKHGPIALINEKCATVACCANKQTFEKMVSNLMEIKARSGPVLAILEEGMNPLPNITQDIIFVPKTLDELASIPTTVVTQLLAYFIAKERGTEIDQPRNLAKSVTVE
jgi:glutamine---fructose-6-phosphate transaminase (isomerizing)